MSCLTHGCLFLILGPLITKEASREREYDPKLFVSGICIVVVNSPGLTLKFSFIAVCGSLSLTLNYIFSLLLTSHCLPYPKISLSSFLLTPFQEIWKAFSWNRHLLLRKLMKFWSIPHLQNPNYLISNMGKIWLKWQSNENRRLLTWNPFPPFNPNLSV